MRGPTAFSPIVAALCLTLPATSVAAAPHLPHWIDWDRTNDAPRSYQISGLNFTTHVRREDRQSTPILEIAAPDGRSTRIEGAQALTMTFAAFLVIPSSQASAPPAVLFRSFSGGAHCCQGYHLITLGRTGFRTQDVGAWDDGDEPEPAQLGRDGRLVFLARDGRFQYRLASHAGSLRPLAVLTLRDDGFEDISADARFSPLFRREVAKDRRYCETSADLGTCLGYIATAARAGDAKTAFAVLDRKPPSGFAGPWTVPEHCGAVSTALACEHEKPEKSFESLHEAAAWFLTDLGYLQASRP